MEIERKGSQSKFRAQVPHSDILMMREGWEEGSFLYPKKFQF